jgi:transposase
MRTDLMPDELWEEAEPLLPMHPPSPKGGRPRVEDRACLGALVYLLREGCSYGGLPCKELGCGSGVTVWRRLQEWTQAGVWLTLHEKLLGHLGRAGEVDTSIVVADSGSCRAVKGGSTPDPIPPTARSKARSGMYLRTETACPS